MKWCFSLDSMYWSMEAYLDRNQHGDVVVVLRERAPPRFGVWEYCVHRARLAELYADPEPDMPLANDAASAGTEADAGSGSAMSAGDTRRLPKEGTLKRWVVDEIMKTPKTEWSKRGYALKLFNRHPDSKKGTERERATLKHSIATTVSAAKRGDFGDLSQ